MRSIKKVWITHDAGYPGKKKERSSSFDWVLFIFITAVILLLVIIISK